MQVSDVLGQARDAMSVKRVFGESYQENGVTIIPVAKVAGGGGGGGSQSDDGDSGSGVGFGLSAAPAGVYVINGDSVRWEPALDLNRVIFVGQIVGIVLILTIRVVLLTWMKQTENDIDA